ncbi:MAG: hypothetical protein HKN87_02745 [Saprospiraceae bacterium]|nr:hypothetical protein [Saprospiraceae bacterium]
MRYLVCAFLLFYLYAACKAQRHFTDIDQWVRKYHPTTNNPDTIARELTAHAINDFQKTRAIYQFLVHHISYDHAVAQKGLKRINRSNHDILKRRRAICWGYAQLMTHMCQQVGIEAYTVSGYSSMHDGTYSTLQKPDHAWNVVSIEDEYYHLDATWASNVRERSDYFFLPEPQQFGEDHYPIMAMWQLLDCPTSINDFKAHNQHLSDSTSCTFAFRDSIVQFTTLPYIDRRLKEESLGFKDNPTPANRQSYAHALMDRAMVHKEEADSLFEIDAFEAAMASYEAALQQFAEANVATDLFPWQQEALGFTYFNYAQAQYRHLYNKGRRSYPKVRNALNEAQRILLDMESESWLVKNALRSIDMYLSQIP